MKKLLKFIPLAATLLTTIILILTIGITKDLEIAESLLSKHNSNINFYIALSSIGGFLPPLIPVFAGFLLIFAAPKESKVTHVISIVLGALFAAFFTWFAWQEGHIIIVDNQILWSILIGVFVLSMDALLAYLAHKISKVQESQTLVAQAILIIVICFMSICGTEGVKLIVSRPRPSEVLNNGFRYWYEFQPFAKVKNSELDSFVSGHTSNSVCLITSLPLLLSFTNLKNNDIAYVLASIVGLLFATVIACSRVLSTAHFISDVIGSAIMSSVVQILALLIVPLATKTTKSINQ